MKPQLTQVAASVRRLFSHSTTAAATTLRKRAVPLLVLGGLAYVGYHLMQKPPITAVKSGEVALRVNQLTGTVNAYAAGTVWRIPGLHQTVVFSLSDALYRPPMTSETGLPMFQSVEGLSFGADLSVRYAISADHVRSLASHTPESVQESLVQPAIDGVVYKVLSRYTVREIFSSKRAEILQTLETELKPALARDGLILKNVHLGRIELPADYKAGVEQLLAEELATEKMRYTLELKEKLVKQSALESDAEKIKREKRAEAAAQEQIIAAKAQEEAMKHVLPFKQRQIEQRQLEAEATRVARIKQAEGEAQARRIEAAGEADSRKKLAEADAFRMDQLGRTTAEQMAREGELISKHPLLIQKTMADRLSDKVAVIIAPPNTGGEFIGANLIGKLAAAPPSSNEMKEGQ
jgi:regulator of protease activity HflC (stomatin/prohibitin superfamily)